MATLYPIKHSPLYKVTRSGGIYSLKNNRFLKPDAHNRYAAVFIIIKGVMRRKHIHRIVCETFHKNPLKKPCVNHKNGVKRDNRALNLEWCTHKENINHSINHNLHNREGWLYLKRMEVIDTKTGKVYDSIRNAAIQLGMDRSHLTKSLSGVRKNKTTLKLYNPCKH